MRSRLPKSPILQVDFIELRCEEKYPVPHHDIMNDASLGKLVGGGGSHLSKFTIAFRYKESPTLSNGTQIHQPTTRRSKNQQLQ